MINWDSLNRICNKAMPYVTPIGLAIGFLLGDSISAYQKWGTYIFSVITLIGAMGIEMAQLKLVVKRLKAIVLVLFSTHIVLPVFITLLSKLCFPAQEEFVTGFLLLSCIPIAVSAFIWCTIYDGDAPLALFLILLDTLLAPLLTPLTIHLLGGTTVQLDSTSMIKSLMIMIVVPSLIGVALRRYVPHVSKKAILYLNPATKLMLVLVVILTVSPLASSLTLSWDLVPLTMMNLVAIAMSFALVYLPARYLLKEPQSAVVSMTFGGGMRNISAALLLAGQFFPPLVSLPVIIGIVVQQTFVGLLALLFFTNGKHSVH